MQRLDSENKRRVIAWVWDENLLLNGGKRLWVEEEKSLSLFLTKKSVLTVSQFGI